jgi:hypothetical protein
MRTVYEREIASATKIERSIVLVAMHARPAGDNRQCQPIPASSVINPTLQKMFHVQSECLTVARGCVSNDMGNTTQRQRLIATAVVKFIGPNNLENDMSDHLKVIGILIAIGLFIYGTFLTGGALFMGALFIFSSVAIYFALLAMFRGEL